MVIPQNRCIFCGVVGRLTKEHIWANWLKAYIPKDMVNYQAGTVTVDGLGRPLLERGKTVAGDPHSLRVKCVCEACNNGWMSRLQERAKPVVLPLIKGETTTLTRRKQELASAWIAMAVICAEFGDRSRVAVQPEDRQWLMTRRMPPATGWKIWIGRHQRSRLIRRPHLTHYALRVVEQETGERPFRGMPFFNTQATTYVVGELHVHAISSAWPRCVSEWRFPHPYSLRLRRIWPPRSIDVRWPPKASLSNEEASFISSCFFDRLSRMIIS
jgi:hypothetical protein